MSGVEARERSWLACALAILAVFGVFLLTHPYRGIIGDALIYVTRELARFDPQGLGQDFLFVGDEQTEFTAYSVLIRWLLRIMPAASAAATLAFAGQILWFAGASLLGRELARNEANVPVWRGGIVIVWFMVLFPLTYAPDGTFTAAEAMAIPRPMAEALVMAGFAALLSGRWSLAAASLAGAFLVHPLMTLAALGVVFVYLALADRRWWLLGIAGAFALIAAAWAGVPVADRLFQPLDAVWRALLEKRTSYLFLSLAPATFWLEQSVSALTIILCARISTGPIRRMMVAVLIATFAGVLLSFLFADRWVSVLILQLQPWRVLWILNVLAPAAMALLALRLWPGRRVDRLVLAFLAMAWIARDVAGLALPMGAAALMLHLEGARLEPHLSKIWVPLLWTAVAAIALLMLGVPLYGLVESMIDAPPGLKLELSYVWTLHPLALPLGALAVAWSLRERAASLAWLGGLASASVALAAANWDDRPAFQAALETRQPPVALVEALPPAKQPILWLRGGKETWYWLSRPNWGAAIQGASVVFSRPTAMLWRERASALIASGLEPPTLLAPWEIGPRWTANMSAEAFANICNRSDAPAAIVAPLSEGEIGPVGGRVVSVPIPAFNLRVTSQGMDWARTDRYAVVSCAHTQ
ncbi:MAG: hypothetical protein JWL62_1502 [Hyphomicrobiales bacterium]|nr:hypothetical protein [Hyphomicrobiales bacterium]